MKWNLPTGRIRLTSITEKHGNWILCFRVLPKSRVSRPDFISPSIGVVLCAEYRLVHRLVFGVAHASWTFSTAPNCRYCCARECAAEYNPLPTLHLILSSILIMAAILFALLQFARRSSSINHTARQKRLRNFNAVILVICLAGLHDISLSSYADARSEFPQLVGHLIAVAYLVFVTSILLPSLSGGLPHSGRWRVAHLSARIMVGAGLCVYLYLFGTLAKIFLSRPVKSWEMTIDAEFQAVFLQPNRARQDAPEPPPQLTFTST